MQDSIYYVVPQEEAPPEKFESINYMKPQDVTVAKELTLKLGEIFPDGFVRDENRGVLAEESLDEKIVSTLFLADELEAVYKGVPPVRHQEDYYELQARADALRNSPDPEILEKALKTEAALRWMDLFVKSYEDPIPKSESGVQSVHAYENYSYMHSLYTWVVQPALLMIGRREADWEKILGDMAAVEARNSVKKHAALVSLRDAFARPGDFPAQKILDYNNRKVRRFS